MSGHRVLKASILALPIFCASVACALAQQAPASEAAKNLKPVTNEMLRNPPAADWLMWRRTYDGYGYSPLDQINKDNVKNLKPAWSWSMSPGATETTPIVHDGVLFLNQLRRQDPGARRRHRRPDLGIQARPSGQAAVGEFQSAGQAQHGDLSETICSSRPRTPTSSRSMPRPGRWCGIIPSPIGPRAGATRAARSSSMTRSSRA